MAQYAIAFDLDTKSMKSDGLTQSDITKVYQTEIPTALNACGFTAHPQGSLYHTEAEQDQITSIMNLQKSLMDLAPSFCKYVSRVHVFRMEEWSDVTPIIANRVSAGMPSGDEEFEEQEALSGVN